MTHTIYDPIFANVSDEARKRAQEDFGRHLVEQRNRMVALVRRWIETDAKFPIPIYDRVIERIRRFDLAARADIASIAILMADQVVTAVLGAFAHGDEMRAGDDCVNYAIVAQLRLPGSDEVSEQLDINRGEPIVVIWDMYKRWLNRYASSEVRPLVSGETKGGEKS